MQLAYFLKITMYLLSLPSCTYPFQHLCWLPLLLESSHFDCWYYWYLQFCSPCQSTIGYRTELHRAWQTSWCRFSVSKRHSRNYKVWHVCNLIYYILWTIHWVLLIASWQYYTDFKHSYNSLLCSTHIYSIWAVTRSSGLSKCSSWNWEIADGCKEESCNNWGD